MSSTTEASRGQRRARSPTGYGDRHSSISSLVFDSPYGENRHYRKGPFVRELPAELIVDLLRRIVEFSRPPVHVSIESLHGAPKDADPGIGGIAYRGAAFSVSAMAVWREPELDGEHIAWARDTAAAIERWSYTSGGYVNYMQADEPIERVRAAFGDQAFERLQTLKKRYDPDKVLRRARTSCRSWVPATVWPKPSRRSTPSSRATTWPRSRLRSRRTRWQASATTHGRWRLSTASTVAAKPTSISPGA
jgi:Berberine and berberine like